MLCCCRCASSAPVLLQLAEATVIHNEVQLQESLEGRMLAEQQVHSLRLQLEDGQALLDQLKLKLNQLVAVEQAAAEEAAAVRSALQAAVAGGVAGGSAAGSSSPVSSSSQQRPGGSLSLGEEVGAAVGTLVQRIKALEQQLAAQQQQLQEAATAAAQQHQQQQVAAPPAAQAVGVQCEPPAPPAAQAVGVQCEAAVQASAGVQAAEPHSLRASAAQTDAGQPEEDVGYGRADPQQQQVAQLTAQLAAARLAEVGAKAELAATEARLLEAEHKVRGWVGLNSFVLEGLFAVIWGFQQARNLAECSVLPGLCCSWRQSRASRLKRLL
jgi:hypothetical protein